MYLPKKNTPEKGATYFELKLAKDAGHFARAKIALKAIPAILGF